MSFLGVSDIGVALIIPGVLELVGKHLEIYFLTKKQIETKKNILEIFPPLHLLPLQVCWITACSARAARAPLAPNKSCINPTNLL